MTWPRRTGGGTGRRWGKRRRPRGYDDVDAADAMRLLEYKGLLNDTNDRADRLDVEPTDELAAIARRSPTRGGRRMSR